MNIKQFSKKNINNILNKKSNFISNMLMIWMICLKKDFSKTLISAAMVIAPHLTNGATGQINAFFE